MNSLLDSASERTRLAGLICLGAVQVAIYGVLAIWEGYQTRPHIAMLLALLAFAFYVAGLVAARRLSGRRAFAIAITFTIVLHVRPVPSTLLSVRLSHGPIFERWNPSGA